ncbi:MAG TPA: glycoside hydrolase family 3 N-terminal domain-containing protein [Bryobacteraceae bacterium]|nr:glycoside hydrolase family 3 N-terminal domain-containing protein [Bryobacteraceae bacterium]
MASPSLLGGLSLHDRIAQLIVVRGYGDYPPSDDEEYRRFTRWITEDHVGGFIVAGHIRNGSVIAAQPFEMAVFVNHMQRLAKTPLLVASDFERGASMRVANTARFPYLMAFGAAHDLDAMRQLGAATAREARSLGVTWVFAPDADVNNNPDNPIINVRSYGEDPHAVAAGVSAFIEGAHADKSTYVLLTAKHFPGHGDTAEDSHMQLAKLDHSKERLEALELMPFRAAIAHGVDSIMTAHMSVPAFEPQAIPATVSRNILTNLLRDELGFKGIVVTDAMDMQGITALYSTGEAAVRAIEAGADVLLMPTDPAECIRALEAAVASGRISRQRIDLSAAKILAAKQRAGLFRSRLVNLDAIADQAEDKKLEALAQQVANRAVTLVKDEQHLFPIPSKDGPCLVILAEGAFSTRGETLARELRRHLPALKTFVANPAMPAELLSAIAGQTAQCKQIYAAAFITVAANRGSVALEGGLGTFLKSLVHGTAPVALLSFGNPYLLRDVPEAGTYAAMFSTAVTSESAAARAILGEIPITGKMPVSIPGLAKIGDGLTVAAQARGSSN